MKKSVTDYAHEKLLRNEKLLRLATEASKVGVWEMELTTNEIQRNVFYDQAFGYEKLQDKWDFDKFKEYLHPHDKEEILYKFESSINSQNEFQSEFRVVWKDESIHWLAISAKYDSDRLVGTILDITEKKLSEETLREALFYRDEFLSIASHELKTPLTSLKLQSQLFKRLVARNDPDTYRPHRIDRLIDQTDRHVTRLVRLVDDMLDISRIRTGRLSISKEVISISDILLKVVESYKNQFSNPVIGPHIDFLDEAMCPCDKSRMEQVFNNIISNAYRYGDAKPIHISLKKNSETIQVCVTDNGIGIAPENLENIFSRFKRAVPAREVSGLGLGLFIARQIIQGHNGKIEVSSQLGKGSTFTIILPCSGVQ